MGLGFKNEESRLFLVGLGFKGLGFRNEESRLFLVGLGFKGLGFRNEESRLFLVGLAPHSLNPPLAAVFPCFDRQIRSLAGRDSCSELFALRH